MSPHVALPRDEVRGWLRAALGNVEWLERACHPEHEIVGPAIGPREGEQAVTVDRDRVLAFVDIARAGLLKAGRECGFQERDLTEADL